MEINGVDRLSPALTPILQNRIRDNNQVVPNPSTPVPTSNPDIPLADSLLIQAQTFVNEILQNQTSGQQTELLLNEVIVNLNFAEQVDLLSLSRILLNEGQLTLGVPRSSGILIEAETLLNETLQRLNNERQADLVLQTQRLLEAALLNLNPAQQASTLLRAEVSITEALQNLNTFFPVDTLGQARSSVVDETLLSLLGVENATGNFIQPPLAIDLQNVTTPAVTQIISPPVATAAVTTTVANEIVRTEPPFSLPEVNPTPFGISVYEVDRLKKTELEPEPDPKKVKPTPPIDKSGFIDMILARPRWPKEEGRHSLNVPLTQGIGEEALRRMIKNFNEEQVNKNKPLHLVLAKSDAGLALDLYDCSDNYVCKLVYDASLSSGELPHLLDNIQHEAGVFLDTET